MLRAPMALAFDPCFSYVGFATPRCRSTSTSAVEHAAEAPKIVKYRHSGGERSVVPSILFVGHVPVLENFEGLLLSVV